MEIRALLMTQFISVLLVDNVNLCFQVVDFYTHSDIDLRLYMVMILLPLILLNLVRNLKWLAPFSMIANILMAAGVGITFYYVFSELPPYETRPHFASFHQLPLFFGTAIFALEGIGVVSLLFIYPNLLQVIIVAVSLNVLTPRFLCFKIN